MYMYMDPTTSLMNSKIFSFVEIHYFCFRYDICGMVSFDKMVTLVFKFWSGMWLLSKRISTFLVARAALYLHMGLTE